MPRFLVKVIFAVEDAEDFDEAKELVDESIVVSDQVDYEIVEVEEVEDCVF